MTTEEDFRVTIDANPHDWTLRAVFADFLQDRGDPRAEGHRVMACREIAAYPWGTKDSTWFIFVPTTDFKARYVPTLRRLMRHCVLDNGWYVRVSRQLDDDEHKMDEFQIGCRTRREIEDAVALRYLK